MLPLHFSSHRSPRSLPSWPPPTNTTTAAARSPPSLSHARHVQRRRNIPIASFCSVESFTGTLNSPRDFAWITQPALPCLEALALFSSSTTPFQTLPYRNSRLERIFTLIYLQNLLTSSIVVSCWAIPRRLLSSVRSRAALYPGRSHPQQASIIDKLSLFLSTPLKGA